jgi:hypothetical protein
VLTVQTFGPGRVFEDVGVLGAAEVMILAKRHAAGERTEFVHAAIETLRRPPFRSLKCMQAIAVGPRRWAGATT